MRLPYLALLLFLTTPCWSQAQSQSVPRALHGSWRVTAVLPASGGCWSGDKARNLLGTTITYTAGSIRWNGVSYPVTETFPRSLTPADLRSEYSRPSQDGSAFDLAALGIRAPRVTELDLQHDDADITDVTTEVPGDTVLLAGPNRLLLSVCNTWFQATRTTTAPASQRTAQTASTHPQPARKSGL